MKIIKIFLITGLVFLILDSVWLIKIAPQFYKKEIGSLLGPVNYLAAALFYGIYLAGLIYFVIYPQLEHDTSHPLLLSGFIFGFVCYATYDLTNMATLKNWSWNVVVIDMLWGGIVTSATAFLSVWLSKGIL